MTVVDETRSEHADRFADRRILVAIASYCDRELPNTVASALDQAAYPEHVRFSICHQFDDATTSQLDRWADDPRFTIDRVPAAESKGCCWARARTFERFDDEPYLLEIDAHTRFAARWDERYIAMLEALPSETPLLTTYPPSYRLEADGEVTYSLSVGVQRLKLERLNPDLTTRQGTEPLPNGSPPFPSPFLAAGQIFTRGRFCRDVPYDPNFYFEGEEISMAVRAFTHGYDLYCPNENLIWHRYDHGERLHWDDHDIAEHRTEPIARLEQLLVGDPTSLGRFGLGTKRTRAEFEAAADINFSSPTRRTPQTGAVSFEAEIVLNLDAIDFGKGYDCFVFALLSDDDVELHRADIFDPDVLRGNRSTVQVSAAGLGATPTHYLLWPKFLDGTFATRQRLPITVAHVGSMPPSTPASIEVTFDRARIEPRDDYAYFLVVLFDHQGYELARREIRDPAVLDLSRSSVTVRGLHPTEVGNIVVTAVRDNGAIEEFRLHALTER